MLRQLAVVIMLRERSLCMGAGAGARGSRFSSTASGGGLSRRRAAGGSGGSSGAKAPAAAAAAAQAQAPRASSSEPPPPPPPIDAAQFAAALRHRAALRQRAPVLVLPVRGVSFEGRQALVQQLRPGQPVQLLQEPGNPYDPRAVEIRTLAGEQLGHVARAATGAFPQPASFGAVAHVGQQPVSGQWGALVAAAPSLVGLPLDLLPAAWGDGGGGDRLRAALGADGWQQLQRSALARWGGRCAVTGAPGGGEGGLPLEMVPVWAFDHHGRTVSLAGVRPLCAPLAAARAALVAARDAPPGGGPAQAEALQVLEAVMQWRPGDGAAYLAAAQQRARDVGEGWQMAPLLLEPLLQRFGDAGGSG